jgi:hypothetical protein
MNYDRYANKIYEWNKSVGWWDDPDRCLFQTLQLVSTEIAEATEGERKDLMDDHVPHRKMGEVELADALIRLLDFGAHLNLKFEWKVDGHGWTKEACTIGKKHLAINLVLMELVKAYAMFTDEGCSGEKEALMNLFYSMLIQTIADCAESLGYDLEGATVDKMLYNTERLDHKRENRAASNGKKF